MACDSCGGSTAEMAGTGFCSSQCAELASREGDSAAVADMMDIVSRVVAARDTLPDNELARLIVTVHDEVRRVVNGCGGTDRTSPDQTLPNTSRPYFLDLIARIDDATAID